MILEKRIQKLNNDTSLSLFSTSIVPEGREVEEGEEIDEEVFEGDEEEGENLSSHLGSSFDFSESLNVIMFMLATYLFTQGRV